MRCILVSAAACWKSHHSAARHPYSISVADMLRGFPVVKDICDHQRDLVRRKLRAQGVEHG